jgi:colanic acid biosynthesis glycosyl transferase WcaI
MDEGSDKLRDRSNTHNSNCAARFFAMLCCEELRVKILFICQYFPPEMGAPAARVSELARAWADNGHEVTVLTGLPNHPNGVVPQEYRGRPFYRERVDGYDVLRVWLYATPNKGIVRRSVAFASFFLSCATLGSVLAARPDVVIATSPQLLVGAAGAIVSRMMRVPFVFEVRDLWPRCAVELGVFRNRALIRTLELLERTTYRIADRVVVVSEEFIDHIANAGVPRERIAFVPNGVDLNGVLSTRSDPPVEARRKPGVTTVAYLGTHGMCQGLATIVRVAEKFRHDPTVRFLFVGDGAEKAEVAGLARQLNLTNCTFLDPVRRELVASIYEHSDICLVPLRDRSIFETVLPSKMFEIMGVGRPILLSGRGRAARFVEESASGVVAPPEDVDAIAKQIDRLRDADLRAALSVNGRAYVKAHFDRRELARRYEGVLAAAIAPSDHADVVGHPERPAAMSTTTYHAALRA